MNTHRFVLFILVYLFPFIVLSVQSQADLLYFNRLTPKQHLTSGSWNYYILKDSKGFIWVSSINGLNRYDGQRVKQYLIDETDSCALSHNNIQGRIFEDSSGDIWFCTVDAIHHFRRQEDCFDKIWLSNEKGERIQSDYRLLKLNPTTMEMWVMAGRDIYYWDRTSGEKYQKVLDGYTGLNTEIIQYNGSHMVIKPISSGGLEIIKFAKIEGSLRLISREFVLDKKENGPILYDQQEEIWIGSGNELLQFNLKTGNHKEYKLNLENPNAKITGIQRIDEDYLITSTLNDGLYFFDSKRKVFSHNVLSVTEDGLQSFFPEIKKIYVDSSKNIWLSTSYNGIYFANPGSIKFKFWLRNNVLYPNDKKVVKSITQDSYKRIWAYTKQGIFVLDSNGKEICSFPSTSLPFLNAEPFQVMADDSDRIWFCNEKGFFVIQSTASDEELRQIKIKSAVDLRLCYGISQLTQSHLLIATLKDGLYTINASDPSSLTKVWQGRGGDAYLFKDNASNIFLYSLDKGISIFNYIEGKLNLQQFLPLKHMVTGFAEDSNQNQIWVGTHNGLMVMKEASGVFKLDPIPTRPKAISGLLKDESDKIWLSSKDGIYKFDPQSLENTKFNLSDGLQGLEFMDWAFLKTSEGKIAFGGANGINVIEPNKIEVLKEIPKPLVTDILINNQPLDTFNGKIKVNARGIPEISEIVLSHRQNKIEFKFAALDYVDPESNQFWYKMVGVDTSYIGPKDAPFAIYSNLRPGKYLFSIYASNSDGAKDEELKTVIKVNILRPWYRAWWAILAFFCLGASITTAILFHFRRRSIERQEAKKIKELDAFKTKFYTDITHEFRTPLTTILGMTDHILEEPEKWFRDGLQMIRRNGQRVLYLINQILDISKLESKNISLDITQSDIIPFLKYVFESFCSNATTKQVGLHFLSEEDCLVMDFDKEKMQKILVNLISNALKFTDQGGDVYLQIRRIEKKLEILVKDTGIGIAEEFQNSIFNRYFTITNNRKLNEKGTGIGLAIVKELVKLMNGEISVRSEIGVGTSFNLKFPITHNCTIEREPQNEITQHDIFINKELEFVNGANTQNQGKEDLPIVLIIEDNLDVASYILGCLDKRFRIQMAFDGVSGFEKANQVVPDIIISDVMMPYVDGFELCQRLKVNELTNHIPIILLTARADIESKLIGLQNGADEYLIKPFEKRELIARVENLIRLRRMMQEKYSKNLAGDVKGWYKAEIDVEEDPFIMKIREIELLNLSDPDFGIAQLCRKLGVSRSQLYRKVNQILGTPVGEFRSQIKFQKAKDLLESTDFSISDIAQEVGFRSLSSFSYAFKSHFGYSPSDIRKSK